MPRTKAFGHLHRTAAGVYPVLSGEHPGASAPLLPPQPARHLSGWGAIGLRKRRGRIEGLRSSKHGRGISFAYDVYPLLSQAIVPYQDGQASPKANTTATRGGYTGTGYGRKGSMMVEV